MKLLTTFALVLSLILNATLGYVLLSARADAPVARVAAKPALSAETTKAGIWAAVKADDPKAEIQRLRAAGFPDHIIRSIMVAQIREPYRERLDALSAAMFNKPYWKTSGSLEPETYAQIRKLQREQDEAIKALLGPDPEDMSNTYNNRSFTFLPADKAEAVRKVLRDFDDRRMDLYSSGFSYALDQDKMTALDKAQHAAVASVLTPDELLEYDLRTSNTSQSLRRKLLAFNPTEEEFRAIYKLQAQFDEQFPQFPFGMDRQAMQRRSEAERQLATDIKAVLSPERASSYDRLTDFNYVRTSQLVARLALPPETTDTLYGVQKEFVAKRSELMRSGVRPSSPEYAEQARALQQEALAKVKTIVGSDRNVDAYRQYGGSWLSMFTPPQRPSTPPAAGAPAAPKTGG